MDLYVEAPSRFPPSPGARVANPLEPGLRAEYTRTQAPGRSPCRRRTLLPIIPSWRERCPPLVPFSGATTQILLLFSRTEVHIIVFVLIFAVVVFPSVLSSTGRYAAVAAAPGVCTAGAAAAATAAEPPRAAPIPLGAAGEERHEYAVDRLFLLL